jgi:hypothetical protein
LFSYTLIDLNQHDEVLRGDVWANLQVYMRDGAVLDGSITSAESWIQFEKGATVNGNVWSGGYNSASQFALSLGQNSQVSGSVTNSATAPGDLGPPCSVNPNYNVVMATGSTITRDLTTIGSPSGSGTVQGTTTHACTPAAVPQQMPTFTFDQYNYDQSTYHSFTSLADWQNWRSNNLGPLAGTFVMNITDHSPTQADRIDLSGSHLAGDTTFITNAPVYANGIDDANVPMGSNAKFKVVSHYQQPDTGCDVNNPFSNCAIYFKNNFNVGGSGTDCTNAKTTTLLYADLGPIALKNSSDSLNGPLICGAIMGQGILTKNNITLMWDDRIDRDVGFGPVTYEIGEWQELPRS